MAKLDRLGWAGGIAFSVSGVRVGIRTNQVSALEFLKRYLPQNRRALSSPIVQTLYSLWVADAKAQSRVRQMNVAYSGIVRISRYPELAPVLELLDDDLVLQVAARSRRTFVKAGVVAWPDGALLIVGEPGSGRSHLVRHLVEAGARYYSDRCATLDASGRVHPYLTDLLLGGSADEPRDRITIPKSRTGHRSLPVRAVLVTGYQAGHAWKRRTKSAGQGLLTLLRYTYPSRNSPEATVKALTEAARTAHFFYGARGEADELLPRLVSMLGELPKRNSGALSPESLRYESDPEGPH